MSGPEETQAALGSPEDLAFSAYHFAERGGSVHRFESRLIHIGSSPECDLVLDHPTVSRLHARLEFELDGYRISDLRSKNGVRVSGVRVRDGFLRPGDEVLFGEVGLRFGLESQRVEVQLARETSFDRLIGASSQMREIFALLARVAPSDATILIEGASGTGKELVAEAIHRHSGRASGPWVIFDCSAVAPELIESELFGHVRGAFTGAITDRKGVFEAASGGTLFIDEIGELPAELQPKLLRALESGQVRPVGATSTRQTSVRVVAATNRTLAQEVQEGRFRDDLYYRLAVIHVRLPPLSQRSEDIPMLVRHFLESGGSPDVSVSYETMRRLQDHPWPGNVRELKNYVERAVLLSDRGRLETQHLVNRDAVLGEEADSGIGITVDMALPFKDAKSRLVDVFERRYWTERMDAAQGNVSEAARQGGIHRKSLEYLLKKLDLRTSEDPP
ncbi:MAG: AAA family ATPase [Deltaproteobacteria bacterium]|nr:AAA family ATPase [Deltaproteobacteria bacterium]